jgi:predicted dehydrogenase
LKKKNILIIGLGSIGLRHAKILSGFKNIKELAIISKRRDINIKKIKYIKSFKEFNPDYIIISSITSKHVVDLKLIEKHYKNKIVLIEKPLAEKKINFRLNRNKYYVGYNMRYHPVIQFIKNKIKKSKINAINILCTSYLPNWRPGRDYKKIYSSNKINGGGVLLDLSHELDYMQWLFGRITKIKSATVDKISNLKIKAEDRAIINGSIKSSFFTINLNFFSRSNNRIIIIDSDKFSIKGDLINNFVEIFYQNKKKKIKFKNSKNLSYIWQHKDILDNKFKKLCNLVDGNKIVEQIQKIKKIGMFR